MTEEQAHKEIDRLLKALEDNRHKGKLFLPDEDDEECLVDMDEKYENGIKYSLDPNSKYYLNPSELYYKYRKEGYSDSQIESMISLKEGCMELDALKACLKLNELLDTSIKIRMAYYLFEALEREDYKNAAILRKELIRYLKTDSH